MYQSNFRLEGMIGLGHDQNPYNEYSYTEILLYLNNVANNQAIHPSTYTPPHTHTPVISTPTVMTFFVSISTTPTKIQKPHSPGAYSQLYIWAFFYFFFSKRF